jgi:rfaE bifunctional protein kinase chain/domain
MGAYCINKMTNSTTYIEAIEKKLTQPTNILVYGDVMADINCIVGERRWSPERRLGMVLDIERKDYVPGGASNVANCLAALGAHVRLVGVTGDDDTGNRLTESIQGVENIYFKRIIEKGRRTTEKQRAWMGGEPMPYRLDFEDKRIPLQQSTIEAMLEGVTEDIDWADVIYFADYNKKGLERRNVGIIKRVAHDQRKPIVVDPKPENIELFDGCTLLKPNIGHAAQITRQQPSTIYIEDISSILNERFFPDYLVITCGREGMYSKERDTTRGRIVTNSARRVYDQTGAGDASGAALALCLARSFSIQSDEFSLEDATRFANDVGGVVVGISRTATATIEDVITHIKRS